MATPTPVQRAPTTTWTELMINTLLDVYEEKYFHIERGNFKKRHWVELVAEFNQKSGLLLTKENCRSKLDNLKKKYKSERELVVNASGGIRSTWDMYERCDILWGCTPKQAGLPGGMDGGISVPSGHVVNLNDNYEPGSFDLNEDCITSNPSSPHDTTGYVASDCEFTELNGSTRGGDQIGTPTRDARETEPVESPRETVCKIPLVDGKLVSKRKRKQRDYGSPIKPLVASLDRFVDVLKHDSEVKIQLARDQLAMAQQMQFQQVQLEGQRLELEKLKMEMRERAAIRTEELKLKCARMRLDFSDLRGGPSS